jgi:hypothetical protein
VGLKQSAGNRLDLRAAVLGLILFPEGYFASGAGRERFRKLISFLWEPVPVLRLMARVTAQEVKRARDS